MHCNPLISVIKLRLVLAAVGLASLGGVVACDADAPAPPPPSSPPTLEPPAPPPSHVTLGECELERVEGLDAAVARRRSARGLILVTSRHCPACDDLTAVAGAVFCEQHLEDQVIVADVTHTGGSASPRILLYDEGRLVDEHRGGMILPSTNASAINRDYVEHLLLRNGLMEGDLRAIEARRRHLGAGDCVDLRLPGHNAMLLDLSGEDLSGWKIKNAVIAGSSLRGTKLRGADLSYSLISHSDLTGADLEGTRMEDVRWNHVICPNGQLTVHGPCEP